MEHVESIDLHELYSQFTYLGKHVEKIGTCQNKNAQGWREQDLNRALFGVQWIVRKLKSAIAHCERTVEEEVVALQVGGGLEAAHVPLESERVTFLGIRGVGEGDLVDVVVEDLERRRVDGCAEGELEEERSVFEELELGCEWAARDE